MVKLFHNPTKLYLDFGRIMTDNPLQVREYVSLAKEFKASKSRLDKLGTIIMDISNQFSDLICICWAGYGFFD